jgi:hypothetical protein
MSFTDNIEYSVRVGKDLAYSDSEMYHYFDAEDKVKIVLKHAAKRINQDTHELIADVLMGRLQTISVQETSVVLSSNWCT